MVVDGVFNRRSEKIIKKMMEDIEDASHGNYDKMLDKIGMGKFGNVDLVDSVQANQVLSQQQKSELRMAIDKKNGNVTSENCKVQNNVDEV